MSAADPRPLEIFIPYWGDPDRLYATVASILAQDDPGWTLTVVDDCYPDPSVAEHFAGEQDPRIRYERNSTNLGIAGNWERCLGLASGEVMMFMGCDDLLEPGFVGRVRTLVEQHPEADIIQPGVRVIDDEDQPVTGLADRVKGWLRPHDAVPALHSGEDLAASLLRGNWLYWPSLVFRTERVQRFAFRRDLPIILDLALVVDMVADGCTLLIDPEVTFAYRRHSASMSGTTLTDGSRFAQDRRYFTGAAEQMRRNGWPRAARAARLRWTSRLHGITVLPDAVRQHRRAGLAQVLRHVAGR
ncbi:glycosyltransferase involved in cell wall biosynthesis [Nocardioides sp. BE266]|uniref:glycosyltransferase family 2 protein n=1 Tax=Nocardioides sp. BE266 TaxID=2817725 RepID=UPI00285E8082|nr:glycosyltransferase family 2 protein [Nocardioides sp. BE266]MDR7255341.1 glycosyltransferase involved in cell wall biosynthesis [Nocardioides sp. BE266]